MVITRFLTDLPESLITFRRPSLLTLEGRPGEDELTKKMATGSSVGGATPLGSTWVKMMRRSVGRRIVMAYCGFRSISQP